MTDPDVADHVYIEPMTLEVVERILDIEKPDSVLPNLGGQMGLNLSMELARSGYLDRPGIPLLAVVQGIVAFVGYLVFNAPSPLFWGVLTCFATIIPIFGTALVWLPLAGYMALTGAWGPAIGLLLYGGLVVTHVDNVVRFIMQKKMADTHPLVTIFGVFIGLSLFGFMGVIFGPLMLEMFVFCVNIFKKKYLDGTSYKQLFVPEHDIQA